MCIRFQSAPPPQPLPRRERDFNLLSQRGRDFDPLSQRAWGFNPLSQRGRAGEGERPSIDTLSQVPARLAALRSQRGVSLIELIMFIVIVVYLPWFQTEKILPIYNLQRLLGYYATFGLLFGLLVAIIGRARREDVKFRFSHVSDWLFLFMLTSTVVTGILIHIFRINGMAYATYIAYIAHMAVLVPMILIEVPFSKWSHLAYRPFAVYFTQLKKYAIPR